MSGRAEMSATARARSNIALVKYWGKRDADLNLPAAGSLSLTLDALATETRVSFDPDLDRDELVLADAPAPERARRRVARFLDLVRAQAGATLAARVTSENNFPTAAGLASSASAFAALAVAACAALGLARSSRELSVLARRGSGSAARSIFGGLARMRAGERPDGEDACAEPIEGANQMALRMVIAVVGDGGEKADASRDAMERCARTSPLYPGFIASVPADLAQAEAAIRERDVAALGEVAERSALTMHAAAMASRPGILYFEPPSIACFHAIRALRDRGVCAYATADAGPHVKALTREPDAEATAAALRAVPGVSQVIVAGPGGPAEVVEASS